MVYIYPPLSLFLSPLSFFITSTSTSIVNRIDDFQTQFIPLHSNSFLYALFFWHTNIVSFARKVNLTALLPRALSPFDLFQTSKMTKIVEREWIVHVYLYIRKQKMKSRNDWNLPSRIRLEGGRDGWMWLVLVGGNDVEIEIHLFFNRWIDGRAKKWKA